MGGCEEAVDIQFTGRNNPELTRNNDLYDNDH
jgi:hypothetical protein